MKYTYCDHEVHGLGQINLTRNSAVDSFGDVLCTFYHLNFYLVKYTHEQKYFEH